ncbi:MAG TPA: DUF4013 domain-containing protein [Anaerolineaceae bacterium]
MNTPFTSQNLVHLIGFPFRDAEWKQKGLLGILFLLIAPVTLLIPLVLIAGYCYRIMRRVNSGDGEPAMPAWDDWERLFVDGIRLVGVVLVYTFPALVLFTLGFVMAFTIPIVFVFLAHLTSQANSSHIAFMPLVGMSFTWIFYGAGILLSLMIGVVLPAPLCHMVAKDSFGAAFHINEWWPIFRANLGGFILSYLIIIGLSMIYTLAVQALYFTFILCWIIPILAGVFGFYLYLISSAIFAQAYRMGLEETAGASTTPG